MNQVNQVLKEFWGYDSLRPLQSEIINAVLNKKDCLAILPTGGGKSLCYQIPSLINEGLTLVISPLVSLMQEQVRDLNQRKIKAVCIHGGLRSREIDILLDNCIYGDTRVIYMAPERLSSVIIMTRLKKMSISLIAVDEAHCISQWGHDFRPDYQKIGLLRDEIEAPILALTGSATKKTKIEIIESLRLNSVQLFENSIYRENLSYQIKTVFDKQDYLLQFLKLNSSSGIIYLRNRKKTELLSAWLNEKGINSTFYHAGLSYSEKTVTQNRWLKGEFPVMICTNAFGMGINKSDLNWVFHFDLPSTIEDYYQETGRAGRGGQEAKIITLWNEQDIEKLNNQQLDNFPPISDIQVIYQAIVNHFQLAAGAGLDEGFSIDVYEISKKTKFSPRIVFNTIKLIERAGYWFLTEEELKSSEVQLIMDHRKLLTYSRNHPIYGSILQCMLRSYSGLFTEAKAINEKEISRRLEISVDKLIHILEKMNELEIISYQKESRLPKLFFLIPRVKTKNLSIQKSIYKNRKEIQQHQLDCFKHLISNEKNCRYLMMSEYFGEKLNKRCGKCDNCVKSSRLSKSEILNKLPLSFKQINLLEEDFKGTRAYIRRLISEGVLKIDSELICIV